MRAGTKKAPSERRTTCPNCGHDHGPAPFGCVARGPNKGYVYRSPSSSNLGRKRRAETKEYLSKPQVAQVLEAARTMPWGEDEYYHDVLHPYDLARFLLQTGCHPVCLQHPNRYRLEAFNDQGQVYVRLIRAKKLGKGMDGVVVFPMGPQAEWSWVLPFVARIKARGGIPRKSLQGICQRIEEAAGVPFTASIARHTSITLALSRMMRPDRVMALYSINLQQLGRYTAKAAALDDEAREYAQSGGALGALTPARLEDPGAAPALNILARGEELRMAEMERQRRAEEEARARGLRYWSPFSVTTSYTFG